MRQPHLLLLLAALLLFGVHPYYAADPEVIHSYKHGESVGASNISVRPIAHKAAATHHDGGAKEDSNPRHKRSHLPKLPLRRRATPDPGDAVPLRFSPFALTQQMAKHVYLEELSSLLVIQCSCDLPKKIEALMPRFFPSRRTACYAYVSTPPLFFSSSRVTQSARSAILQQMLLHAIDKPSRFANSDRPWRSRAFPKGDRHSETFAP